MNNKHDCSCNDSYEETKKLIGEASKNIRFCYAKGPTGPTGPQGEAGIQGLRGEIGPTGPRGEDGGATIEVGITETVDPDTEALVTNVGTNKEVVLNFKIPKGSPGVEGKIGPTGPKGEQGDVGPIGPKGEDGGATIEVGTTETVDADTEALVTNVGTNKEVVLNFKIPRGSPGVEGKIGPTGPEGPRGLPGEIGISQVITIDGTETVEPGEEAEVQDDFDRNIHHLTFYIPKGEKGDTGPVGPQGDKGEQGDVGPQGEKGETGPVGPQGPAGQVYGLGAYGYRFAHSNQRFNVVAGMETIIPLEETGAAIFTDYDNSYAIEIRKQGIYQINYFLNISTSVDTKYVVRLKASGITVAGSDIRGEAKANSITNVVGSTLYPLKEDEEVTLVITTENATELIFDGTTTASLAVIKID